MKTISLALAFAGALMSTTALAGNIASTPGQNPDLTLYSGGYGLIHEQRKVDLDKGANQIFLQGMPDQTRSDSVLASGKNLTINRRIFDFGTISRDALLKHSLGKTIWVVKTNPATGEETEVEAKVLSIRGGLVLQIGGRIETGNPGRLVFKEIPEGLRAEPALTLIADSAAKGSQSLDLAYLTGGLNWQANYVAQINKDGTALDLTGFAEVTNNTNRTYKDASVRVVAGELRGRPTPPRPQLMRKSMARAATMQQDQAAPEALSRESTGEQHIYRLPGDITLQKFQKQQVTLLSATNIPAKTDYHFSNGVYRQHLRGQPQAQRAEIRLKFKNEKAAGLGIPLPAGSLRSFKGQGADMLFTGEAFLNRKSDGEKVSLTLGKAFDITLKRTQTDFRVKDPKGRDRTFEAAWKLELTNAHSKPVTVVVEEAMSGAWEMLEESQPHKKPTAAKAQWTVELEPNSKQTITFRAKVVPR